MVKFAKRQPAIEENEMSIVNAFFVVNQTTMKVVSDKIVSIKEEV